MAATKRILGVVAGTVMLGALVVTAFGPKKWRTAVLWQLKRNYDRVRGLVARK